MLEDLVCAIHACQTRIVEHETELSGNEIRTRVALIDPILSALGWNVADPRIVMPEYSAGGGRADYALLVENHPRVVVEAKHLNEPLTQQHRIQVTTYANTEGIKYAGLTDGNRWELYDVFLQAPLRERCIMEGHLSATPVHRSALTFLSLWRSNMLLDQPATPNEPIIVERQREPINDDATDWTALAAYNPPPRTQPPSAIRFPDQTVREIRRWNEMPLVTAEWLTSNQALDAARLAGFGWNRQDVPPQRTVGATGITIFMHGPAAEMRRRCKELLESCGYSADTVFVR